MKNLQKLSRLKSATVLTVCLVAIILSASTILPAWSRPAPTAAKYRQTLEDGFMAWCEENHIELSEKMSTEEVQILFMEFLNDEPLYAVTLENWDKASNLETTPAGDIPEVVAVEDVVQYGEVVGEWSRMQTVGGTEYTYVMTEYTFDGQDVVKVTVYTSDGTVVTDPNVYVLITPIKIQVLWWQIQVGEEGFLYEFFTSTNNEALRFKDDLIFQITVTGAITAGIYAITALCGFPPFGLVTIYMGAYVSTACNAINSAYSTWGNRFYIIFVNHFMYTLIGCAFALFTVWADNSVHYIWPDPLYGGLYALNPASAINAQLQSNALHSIGDTYGYNTWVWIGAY